MKTELDDLTRAFFECALWSSTDESDESGGEPLDANYSIINIALPCVLALAEECKRFQAENAADLATYNDGPHPVHDGKSDDVHGGHYFWLTRNDHGSGFWDGEYPKAAGARLTKAAKAYGDVDLYFPVFVTRRAARERAALIAALGMLPEVDGEDRYPATNSEMRGWLLGVRK